MGRYTIPLAAVVLTSLTSACGAGEASFGAVPTVSDSAGVRIVEHPERAWSRAAAWRLEAEPALTIGLIDGPPEYELSRVRSAIRLDDGTVVIADGGSAEIRFFDRHGVHIRSVGRRGAGPGEYEAPVLVARYGTDSLLVWDGALRRGSILGRDGTFARTLVPPDLSGGFPYILNTLNDRSMIGWSASSIKPSEERSGMVRFPATYFRFFPSGELDTIGQFFNEEHYISGNAVFYHIPFARKGVAAAAGEYVHYGSSDTYEIRTYTDSGELVRIIRSTRAFPLTQQDVDAAVAKPTHPRRRRVYSEVPWPETLPAYAEFKADGQDNLWIGDYLRPGEEERGWTIFDPDGELLGTLTTPPRFTLFEAGNDYVLGSARDELDVERVVLYRLVKPGPPRPGRSESAREPLSAGAGDGPEHSHPGSFVSFRAGSRVREAGVQLKSWGFL